MFENFVYDSTLSNTKKKHRQLLRLLLKYVEVQKINEIKRRQLKYKNKLVLSEPKQRSKILNQVYHDFKKRLKPEETYEIWHSNEKLNGESLKNNDTSFPGNTLHTENGERSELESLEGLDIDVSISSDEVASRTEDYFRKLTETFDESSSWTKLNFILRTQGLEILPNLPLTSEIVGKGSKKFRSVTNIHLDNLKQLLHINILRRKWDAAYKAFCLIIRFRHVDIRSLWPLGIEILSRLAENELPPDQSDVSGRKDERFFNWLSSFFSVNKHYRSLRNSLVHQISAPIWRSGSKTHTPIYIVAYMWLLLRKGKFTQLKDKLEELFLEPPYNNEGVFYYIHTLCCISELASFLTYQSHNDSGEGNTETELFVSRDELLQKVRDNIKDIDLSIQKGKDLNFSFPEKLIIDVMNIIFAQLNKFEPSIKIEYVHSIGDALNKINFTNEKPIELQPFFEASDNERIEHQVDDSNTFYSAFSTISEDRNEDANPFEELDFDFDI